MRAKKHVRSPMLDLFVATEEGDIQRLRLQPRVSLAGPTYWFLHRYFVQASLTPGDFSFLNLYEDTELAGYQLQRLRTELQEALVDLSARPSNFRVLVGWHAAVRSFETEEWRPLDRTSVEGVVREFLAAICEAQESGRSIFAIGD